MHTEKHKKRVTLTLTFDLCVFGQKGQNGTWNYPCKDTQ